MKSLTTDILIFSYAHDLEYLYYCLKSISKFCSSFARTKVAVPTQEHDLFVKLCHDHDAYLDSYLAPNDGKKWHIAMQCQKMRADMWCSADFIMHLDSDCVFTEKVTPQDYFIEGKPVMLIEPYSRMKIDGAYQWKQVTEDALKIPVTHETMRRHPQVNPRGIYADLRAHIESVQNMPFDDFILSRKATFPWGCTEHNFIGAFAMNSPKWRDQYHWIDLAKEPRPKDKLAQCWSHSPPNQEQTFPSTGQRAVPQDIFDKLLA